MTIWCMQIACWIPKATNTVLENVIVIAFLLQHGCMNVPQYHIIHTFPTLLIVFTSNLQQHGGKSTHSGVVYNQL